MSFSCPQLTLPEILELARRYGYDAVEARISSKHKHGIELTASRGFRDQCRSELENHAVPICCVATSCRYADPATRAKAVQDTHQAIDLAADLGAPRIRVFGGSIPEGITREDAIEQVAAALLSVADHAGERAVTVCMETHDDWCNPAHVAKVVQRVDRPAIAANWDIAHPVRRAGVTMDEAYQALKPWVRHVHFHDMVAEKDGSSHLLPVGQGKIDHRRAVELLKADDYSGFMSGEWIGWEPFETHLPRELATMKSYEAAC